MSHLAQSRQEFQICHAIAWNNNSGAAMATKRSEQEWREIINGFERYGYQNPAVFYVARDVHAHDLK